ncbi:PBSX family phage terminase large subunit [Paenibacillus sp. Marseille-Q4541]|uniref:PBSX family phage terminase large subunit n=1 Tax=Paenibacillus sp. Marseille-Q4541 TaxID=2831522 RepID=UPI001BA5316A|nr:PBSX family phage terminase large subunit [Paenibacillus sp. Marseille-Q4541]
MATINIDLTELPTLTNDTFYPLYTNKDRYLVLMGGGGSGKSVFTAQKIVLRTLTEKKHRILVLRKVAKTLRESVFMELKNAIYRWGLEKLFKIPKGTSSELHISCINGNEILFAGLDDVEKLKSISGITSVWMEEASECSPEDFRQLDIRLRGRTLHYKQMMITFNPIDINHWLKKEFFDIKKPNATTIHSTYKNNKFLDKEAIAVLEAFKETDPYFYQVYALGEWGVLGKTIFNAQKVNERISQLRHHDPLVQRGYFVYEKDDKDMIVDRTIKWIPADDGYIKVFELPQSRIPYVIGGDTAGDGSDNFTGQVINNVTGKQVAVYKNQFDEDLYAEQMYCLGRYFNSALISIETNFSSHPVKVLMRLGYRNMYVREREDTFTGSVTKAYGFKTDKLTRPSAIAELVTVARENIHLINDMDTLNEMLTFVRNEKGRPEAKEGAHDDLVMALAIGYYSRGQQDETAFREAVQEVTTPFPFRTAEPQTGGYMQW